MKATSPFKITLRLPGLPKTTNSGGRAHWALKVAESRKWQREVFNAVGANRPRFPLQKAKVTLTRCSAVRPDFDGLVSSFKHVLDALTKVGIIIDDKHAVIGQPTYGWEKVKQNEGHVIISVEEIV